ncbi:MAG: oxygenase MpaB family protein [Terracidiphilus sp.]|jgi:uncharacterized protein (DUF2236 family)
MEAHFEPVSRREIERLWNQIRESTTDPRAGIFGPSSLSWKVSRESGLFLGAGRAALLQLVHPWVAAALDEHSNLRVNPVSRFHHTFRVVFTMTFGTLGQALAASRHVYDLHTHIQGEITEGAGAYPKGSRYAANEVGALVWVYATLIESALLAYETVLPPLTSDEREAYYTETKTLAALFGIPPTKLPVDWSGFEDYNRAMLASGTLGVNRLSREMAHRLLHGRGSWVPVPAWYRALTAQLLPAELRNEFALDYGEREENAAARARRWLPRIYRRLPPQLRFVGPFQDARDRLQSRRANWLTRANNRFWMGQSRMMFAEPGLDGAHDHEAGWKSTD